jgi:5S rRNA maturation endonuclease (ribonuclease M5)
MTQNIQSSEFIEKLNTSNLTPSTVLEFMFDNNFATQDKFPNAFDNKGNVLLKFESQKNYGTFCPYHDNQTNGDSFHIYNEDKTVFCFNGGCSASRRPMGIIEIVMSFAFNLDHSVIFDFELSRPYFWKAARFLVEHFGNEIDVTMGDITGTKSFKRNITEEILRDTASYYHFLGTKTNYSKKLEKYLSEARFFQFGVVPLSDIISKYQLGVTPTSDTRDKLYSNLIKKKFTKEQILESKVCYLNDKGEIKDFFYGRIVIPYIHKGKVIGLYGRDFNPNGDKKYRHLRLEGSVRIPNGLDGILESEEFFLVEGEFSKLAVVSLGYSNTMEARGVNGFKTEHAEMIQRVRQTNAEKCKRCYLLFDPDNAGADSVKKIGARLINAGVEVLVCRLPVLYQEGIANFIDPNDLLEIFKDNAKKEFDKIKDEAISLDAFLLLHELKKEQPKSLSEARSSMKRLSHYFDSSHPLERIFLLEEVLTLFETALDKNSLRPYLKEIWLNAEQKKPVEGLEKAFASRNPFLLVTKSEEFFNATSINYDFVILVRDFDLFLNHNFSKSILLDGSFIKEEEMIVRKKGNNVQRGKIELSKVDKTFSYEILEN